MADVAYQREFVECLRRAERREACEVGHLFTWHWTRGWAEHLEAIGVLERTHDAEWWMCDRCEIVSAHVERRYVDDRGVHMAKICCRERGYHLDAVEVEELHQWEVSLTGVARLVGRAISARGPVETLASGRVVRVGVAHSGPSVSDVFLVRGALWDDAGAVVGGCLEIKSAHLPLVFCLHDVPEHGLWPELAPAVFDLPTVATLRGGEMTIPRDLVLARESVPHPKGGGDWLSVTDAAKLVLDVVSGIDLAKARARVSGAVSRGGIRSNGLTGVDRRVEPGSLMRWLFEQRNRDLAKEDLL